MIGKGRESTRGDNFSIFCFSFLPAWEDLKMELLGWSSAWVWELCSNNAKMDKVMAGGSEGLLDWEGRAVCAQRTVAFGDLQSCANLDALS